MLIIHKKNLSYSMRKNELITHNQKALKIFVLKSFQYIESQLNKNNRLFIEIVINFTTNYD